MLSALKLIDFVILGKEFGSIFIVFFAFGKERRKFPLLELYGKQ
jgi:hypothetical protein